MMFWFIFILITVGIIVLLVNILSRHEVLSNDEYLNSNKNDVNFYKNQLKEVDRQKADEQISTESAEEAKLEIARRLLALEKKANYTKNKNNSLLKVIVFIGVLVVLSGSWLLYFFLGNPNLHSQPFETLMMRKEATLNLAENVVKTQTLLARNPNNYALLDILGYLYLKSGRYSDAVPIFNRSLSVNGENAKRLLGYGMALMGLENGAINKQAEIAIQKAHQLEPQNREALLFLARSYIQNGKTQKAIELLENFIHDYGKNQSWAKDLQNVIDQLKYDITQKPQKLTKEQKDFILNNIVKLESQVQNNPQDIEAWFMLINAYYLLDQTQKMYSTYQHALKILSFENKNKLIIILKDKGFSLLLNSEAP